MNNKNCKLCGNYKDGYCKELELKPCYPEKGCDYFIRQNAQDVIKELLKNEYKRGWCDALSKALDEAYTIHSEEGSFQVVQIETLIGLGYAIDDPQESEDTE